MRSFGFRQSATARWCWRATAALTLTALLGSTNALARKPDPRARPRPAEPTKAEKIKEAFTRARLLFRQSRYQAAIRAFDEVKDLKYHPILDYGIAKCYEALDNLQSAIYYLRKYLRNLPRFTMSKRHPTIADAKVKIGVLQKRLAEKNKARVPPGPGPIRVVTPPPPPGPPERRAYDDVVPGPYPFTQPGPPLPPVRPEPPRKKRYVRKSVMLHFSIGGGTFTEDSSDNFVKPMNGVGGVSMAILWRFMPYLAVGPTARISGGVTSKNFDDADNGDTRVDTAQFMYANVLLELRAFLPLGPVDIWGAFAIGYASLSRKHTYTSSSGEPDSETALRSLGVGGKVGLDIFTGETFSLGFRVAFLGTVPVKKCITDQDCVKPVDRDKPGMHWYLGMTFTWHLRLSSIAKPEPSPRPRRRK